MERLFNVKTDAQERYKLINAISRVRLMISLGHYDDVMVYGRKSSWQIRSARGLIERYEQRLRELSR